MALTRYLPQDCRITIPPIIRERLKLHPGDPLSFTLDGDTICIRRERLCDNCATAEKAVDLDAFFDSLSPEQQQRLISHLSRKLLTQRGGARCGRL